jgi:transcriptional regulator with XRE-family HTH domain
MKQRRSPLGLLLYEIRQQTGLPLTSAARRLGINHQHISEFERGVRMPESSQVVRYAKRLGLDERRWLELWQTFTEHYPAHFNLPNTSTQPSSFITAEIMDSIYVLYHERIEKLGGYMVNIDGTRYPSAFFPARGASLDNVIPTQSMDARACAQIQDDQMAVNDSEARLLRNRRRDQPLAEIDTFQGYNVCADKFSLQAGHHQIHACLGTYGQILDSCDCLLEETCTALMAYRPEELQYHEILNRLPHRRSIELAEPDLFTTAQHRAAGIGISSLLVYKRANDWHIMLARRSRNVGAMQGFSDVIPSTMLGWHFSKTMRPDGTDKKPWGSWRPGDISLAILRSYASEVLSSPVSDQAVREQVRNHQPIRQLINRYGAKISYVGLCFDLLTLRPELVTILMIPDARWSEEVQVRPNNEYSEVLSLSLAELHTHHLISPASVTPTGATALWMGIEYLRDVEKFYISSQLQSGFSYPYALDF